MNNRVVVPVDFTKTGHPFLDTKASKKFKDGHFGPRPRSAKEGWSMNAAAARAIDAAHDLLEKVSPLRAQVRGVETSREKGKRGFVVLLE